MKVNMPWESGHFDDSTQKFSSVISHSGKSFNDPSGARLIIDPSGAQYFVPSPYCAKTLDGNDMQVMKTIKIKFLI
tara:strand:+ start:817 stop:1044 length:228 start_codon:yes stop_codon:yes gene_type:complete